MTRNQRLVLVLSIAAGATCPGAATAQTAWVHYNHAKSGNITIARAAWTTRRTDHFDIFYQPEHAGLLDAVAREAERAYSRVSFDLKHALNAKVPLILVQTRGDVPTNSRQAGDLVRASGAPDGDHVVLPLESAEDRGTVLVHELTHQFIFEMIPTWNRVPAWVHEGLADHETGSWTASDLLTLRNAIAAGAIPRVATLADSDRAWGHAVFDFIAAEYGIQGIQRYVAVIGSNSPPADAALAAFGITATEFERAFQTYVRIR